MEDRGQAPVTGGNVMGVVLVLALFGLFWGGVGFSAGHWLCRQNEQERIAGFQLEARVEYASQAYQLGTELTLCAWGVERAITLFDSVHIWAHGGAPRSDGIGVVGLSTGATDG